ncbi:GNAT family N-acetyltransferase [Bacillus sp. JCM 19041]|uniref:GNAT family N-acetyltransferase n=1 Tax=Bacillus sp. JCM 19041 TaxID=1460637 RepID=UPI0006D21201
MSIEKLTRKDATDIVALFGTQKNYFLFVLDQLHANNYEENGLSVYGEKENGQLVSFILNQGDNLSYFAQNVRDVTPYLATLQKISFRKLTCESRFADVWKPHLSIKQDTVSWLGFIHNVKQNPQKTSDQIEITENINAQTLSELYDLFTSTAEFANVMTMSKLAYIEEEHKRYMQGGTRTFFGRIAGRLVATVATTAEYDRSTIITGVFTNPDFRGNGYGTHLLTLVFKRLLQEGKTPYFFYNNPKARSVYLSIGLQEICDWRVLEILN